MSAVTVKRLTQSDDLSNAIRLLQRFFLEEGFRIDDTAIAQNARHLAALDVCGLFVAFVDGVAAGVATVSMEFGIEHGWSAEMGDLYVLPEKRGIGISKHLVGAVEEFLRSKGASGYQVTVTLYAAEQHGIAALYQRLGFEDESREILWKALV
jgi:GNAT superfamily N-acetyltransferase